MQGFSLQLKIDRLKYLSWWLYFSSRREPSVLKTGTGFPYMLYRALLKFFAKREGKIHSNFDKQKLFNLSPHSAYG